MAVIKIKPEQAERLLAARTRSSFDRKRIKKEVFSEIRREYGIPSGTKFRIAVESPDNPNYLIVRNKHTDRPLDDGQAPKAAPAPALAAGKSPALEPATEVKPKATKKPAAAKAPAKKAAAKATAKKTVVKDYPCEVRATIGGKRVRLGQAKDAKHEARLIAKYKKDNGIS